MSEILENLLSKNGLTAKKISKELFHIEEGERIPRVDDFSEKLSTARGTVQSGLKVLERIQAIKLESRGHLGTFLIYKNAYLLKKIAGEDIYMGTMPLPYSLQYEGLATGLLEASESEFGHINMAYMRGSRKRVKGLKSQHYDFAVMSLLAAEEEIKENDQLKIAADFGPESFVTSHQIFLANPENDRLKDGMRVGIDYSSADQSLLTQMACEGLNVELVPITYMQVYANLRGGELDAAVWNIDESRVIETFKTIDFSSNKTKSTARKASEAAVLIEKDRGDVQEIFEQLDKSKVKSIQQQVVNKEKLPQY